MIAENCSTPQCGGVVGGGKRGKCQACYQALRRLVLSGETTWDALVAAGECEKPANSHRTAYVQGVRKRLAKLAEDESQPKGKAKSSLPPRRSRDFDAACH